MKHTKICPYCGKEFVTEEKRQTFCSRSCAQNFRHDNYLEQKSCIYCGELFTASDHSPKYCSRKCYRLFRSACYLEQKGIEFACPHNVAIECYTKKCDSCGWNPEVAKARLEAYERKRKGEV